MNSFVQKLRLGAPLTATDETALLELTQHTQRVAARQTVLSNDDSAPSILVVLNGWMCSQKSLENGRRQVIAVHLAGDMCHPFGRFQELKEITVEALTPAIIAKVPTASLRSLAKQNDRIERALWWDLTQSCQIERERIVSLGRRTASERLAHLVCEIHHRRCQVQPDAKFMMPMVQSDIADLLGLSAVHVNRSLRELKEMGFISFANRKLDIMNLGDMEIYAQFDDAYLATDNDLTINQGADAMSKAVAR